MSPIDPNPLCGQQPGSRQPVSRGSFAPLRSSKYFIVTLTIVGTLGCNSRSPQPSKLSSTGCQAPAPDSLRARTQILYAQNFTVTDDDPVRSVTVRRPWRGADKALTTLLPTCGTPVQNTAGELIVPIVPRRVVTTSSTQLPHIIALGVEDSLVGHDRFDYVSTPVLRDRIDQGRMTEVGDGVRLNTEVLLDLRPDLVFVFSIGNPELDVLGSLRDARIPFAIDAAWMEDSPLARAEWVKYTALFFGREAEAEEWFAPIARRYEELAQLAQTVVDRPRILIGAPYRGTWYVSGGASFQARYLKDAGADYLWANDHTAGSIPLDFEAVYAAALDADIWLHPSNWSSLDEALDHDIRMGDFKAFKHRKVYNNDARMNGFGGNDYWESGSARPDQVLADLIHILHPNLLPDHQLVFHRQLVLSSD